jgi:hypothetical protein
MEPYTAVLGAVAGAAKAPPAGPSEAKSSGKIGGAAFDNSGWNITFGTNSAIQAERTQTTQSELQKYLPYVLVGVAGLLAWRVLKK